MSKPAPKTLYVNGLRFVLSIDHGEGRAVVYRRVPKRGIFLNLYRFPEGKWSVCYIGEPWARSFRTPEAALEDFRIRAWKREERDIARSRKQLTDAIGPPPKEQK